MVKQYRNNQHLLKSGGVIDRFAYFRNVAIIMALSIIVTYITGGYQGPVDELSTGIFGLIFLAYLTYFLFINSFKRLRDIRGTTERELLFNVGLVLLFLIPFVSLATLLFLLFARGRVTAEEALITPIESKKDATQKKDYMKRMPEIRNDPGESRPGL